MICLLVFSSSELGEQDDPEADDEIIREYENFVQDFEDHLLMQEFGPAHH